MGTERPPPPTSLHHAPRKYSFLIARVSGIEIRVHLTFFLLVALFALGSTGPGGLGLVSGLIWLALIFTCVVVHELAHSLIARRRGAEVREIVLLPIGGVSKLEHLPETPSDEFAIAVVGPAASVALALGAGLVAALLRQPLLPVDLYGGPLLARLAWFNLIIAGFNLLPAFPLDGGRVFRSLLERRYSLERATHIAARIGRGLALTLVIVGVLVNLWLLIIGVFVFFGASAEETATVAHLRMRAMHIPDVMLLDPVVVDSATTANELHMLLRRTAQRAFPVVDAHGYQGMLDAAAIEHSPPNRVAGDLAFQQPALSPTSQLEEEALPLVVGSPARAAAVIEHGGVVGLLRVDDIRRLVSDREPRAGGPRARRT
jgi:Zn-dependent protease/CBS domain-containing protein